MPEIKRHRIDWDNIEITIVPADLNNPNPLNPYSRMTPKERREAQISKCAEILVRIVKDRLVAGKTTTDGEIRDIVLK